MGRLYTHFPSRPLEEIEEAEFAEVEVSLVPPLALPAPARDREE